MTLFIDTDSVPKRGDLIHTNVGSKRERTCFVLRVRKVRRFHKSTCAFIVKYHTAASLALMRKVCDCGVVELVPRFKVWCERWWQIELDTRMRLYCSAERNGGQVVHHFVRYRAKHKQSFDQHLALGIRRKSRN